MAPALRRLLISVIAAALLVAAFNSDQTRASDPESPSGYQVSFSFPVHIEGFNIRFAVTLNRQAEQPLTLKWRLAGGTVSAADLGATSGTFTVNKGVSRTFLYIPTVDDDQYEGRETIEIELYDLPDGVTAETGEGEIVDNDANPMPKIRRSLSYSKVFVPLPPRGSESMTVSISEAPGKGNAVTATFKNPRPDLFEMTSSVSLRGDVDTEWKYGLPITFKSKVGADKGIIRVNVPVTLSYRGSTIAGRSVIVYVNHSSQFVRLENSVQRSTVSEGDRKVEYQVRLKSKPNGLYWVTTALQQAGRMTRGGYLDQSIKPAKRTEFARDYDKQPLVFTPDNWNQWQTISIDFLEDIDTDDEVMRLFFWTLLPHHFGNHWYVSLIYLTVLDTGANAPPKRVSTLTYKELSSESVIIHWDTAGGVSGYQIRYWETDGGTSKKRKVELDKDDINLKLGGFDYKLDDIDPARSYRVRVHPVINGKTFKHLASGILRFTSPPQPDDTDKPDATEQPDPNENSSGGVERGNGNPKPDGGDPKPDGNDPAEPEVNQSGGVERGNGNANQPVSTTQQAPPAKPTRVGKATPSDLTSTAVSIGWNSAGDVAGYQIRYWETDGGEVERRKLKLDDKVLTLSNSKFSHRITDLEAGRSYRLRVHVVLKSGKVDNRLSSGVLRFTTPAAP